MAKLDTRAIGLDGGLKFIRWLTGGEHLHYGYWPGLEVNAGNFGAAQEAYSLKLFEQIPKAPRRILDIGGGAGETAKKLLALGHHVEIVVPSPLLADRCRVNAPGARVHEMTFEEFDAAQASFDLCLFSESYQYFALEVGLSKAFGLLAEGGEIVIADCFRREGFRFEGVAQRVGGGHPMERFRETLDDLPLTLAHEEDITEAVAPSVDIEQELFNVIGYTLTRIDTELESKKPFQRSMLNRLWRLLTNERTRARLDQRLNQKTRNAQAFAEYNRYLILRFEQSGAVPDGAE
ncbi:MAG: class I SAM-dependent methyltransferase [Pseudomonadota bacterium]